MSCPKCGTGLLVNERVYERWEARTHLDMVKCCNCGLYDDPLMRLNRSVTGSSWPVIKSRQLAR